MTPSRQQLLLPVLVFIFLSAQLKIMTKVNIWDQVYFGQTNSSLLSKIRESVGCTRLGASCRRSLSGSYSVLFPTVAALEKRAF